MNNLALAVIDGNLTADPETKVLKGDKSVTTFSVALNHEYGSKEDNKHVSFINVEAWDRLAENCGMYLKKGSRVTVQGQIRQDRWKDDRGNTRERIKIVASNVRFDSVTKKAAADAA
jgi:single-strand DNA-binding protein